MVNSGFSTGLWWILDISPTKIDKWIAGIIWETQETCHLGGIGSTTVEILGMVCYWVYHII